MLGGLLAALNEIGCPTIVVADGIAPKIQKAHVSKSLNFENERLDLAAVGRECDLAILNGNHGTSVSFLLAGRPMLQIPLHLEQSLFSQRVAELGAALIARPDRPEQMALRLVKMLSRKDRFTAAAQRFAERYQSFEPHQAIARMVDRADQLCRAAG
jgi:UDP:flavonoid glycosyltransferase YjiC (YdhE family)